MSKDMSACLGYDGVRAGFNVEGSLNRKGLEWSGIRLWIAKVWSLATKCNSSSTLSASRRNKTEGFMNTAGGFGRCSSASAIHRLSAVVGER